MRSDAQQRKTVRVLLCAPGDNLEGGIAAVVDGLRIGFDKTKGLEYKIIQYAKSRPGIAGLKRVLAEIMQLLQYCVQIVAYAPDFIQVETSFDKKTVIRDSVHMWIAHLRGKPFVLHAHGGEWHLGPTWSVAWRWYVPLFLSHCSRIVVTSREELSIIRRTYGEAARVKKED